MEKKSVSASKVVMAYRMLPQDANPAGNVHGGSVMKLMDSTCAAAAMRHCRRPVVTVTVDRMVFLKPVFVGELITMMASLNLVGRTSMEVGVRVTAENLVTGEVRHTNSAYFTFVALGEDGRPTPIPDLLPETEEDHLRMFKAKFRKEMRAKEQELERKAMQEAQAKFKGIGR